jgi:hypothetical protein
MGMDRTSTFKAMFKEYLADVLKAEERGKKDPFKAEKRAKDGEVAKIKAFFDETFDGLVSGGEVDVDAAWDKHIKDIKNVEDIKDGARGAGGP